MQKEVTLKQYNKLMDKLIKLEDKVSVQDKLIMLLEEAAKYIIVEKKRYQEMNPERKRIGKKKNGRN